MDDKDYLKNLLTQFSSMVLIKVSLIMIRDDLFSDDAYEFIFELEFLPKMGPSLDDKPQKKDNLKKSPYHIDKYGRR